jgi:hypothetical protein
MFDKGKVPGKAGRGGKAGATKTIPNTDAN